MNPYSPQIPWVYWAPAAPDFYEARCEVCGAGAQSQGAAGVHAFAQRHAAHTAGAGHLGLGDAVAAVAKPIAAAFGQQPCSPCEARRRALNSVRMRRFW